MAESSARRLGPIILATVALGGLGIAAAGYIGRSDADPPSDAAGETLDVGDRAPGVALAASNGEMVDLAELRAAGPVLLYFYEHPG